ncbi:MAG: peptidase C1 [Bacteroidetes bacterium]|nr:peptidase C1 [Bacteroidota bacterium]
MKYRLIFTLLIIITSSTISVFAQPAQKKDKAIYAEKKNGYYQNVVLKNIEIEEKNKEEIKKTPVYFSVDFSNDSFPNDTSKYTKYWHNNPLNQGLTGTCWCFAGTSFAESEIARISGKKVKLSEMYTVYWEYVERAKLFVAKRGNMYFNEGSESNGVIREMAKYGAVPSYVYTGRLAGKYTHNHSKMIEEMKAYLESVKQSNLWNEENIIATIKSILNFYMGEPPTTFNYDNKPITPVSYLTEILQFKPNEYFSFMSTRDIPYNQKGLLDEPDNWWKAKDYYNLSLKDYMDLLQSAISKGYTIAICGDVSEPGYNAQTQVAIIPSFDIPAEYINEDARQYRLENNTTTDDHCIHIVGYQKIDNVYWYLIKDSSSSGFDGKNKGYRFYHEDYIKLKMMNLLMHRDAARAFLDKIIK